MLNQYFPIEDVGGRQGLTPKTAFTIVSPWGPVVTVGARQALRRHGAPVWPSVLMVPVVLFVMQAGLGSDSALSTALSATAEVVVAMTVFILSPPDARFWMRLSPLIVLVAAAFAWIAQPLIAPHLLPWRSAAIVAPDLAIPGVARMVGTAALLGASAALGYRRGAMRRVIDAVLLFGIFEVVVALVLHQVDLAQVGGVEQHRVGSRFAAAVFDASANACLFAVLALLGTGRLLAALRDRAVVDPTRSEILAPYLGCLAVAAGIGGCAVTGSHAATGTALVLLVALVVGDREVRRHLAKRAGPIVMVLAATGVLLALGIFGDLQFEWLDTVRHAAVSRLDMWRDWWDIAWSARWSGYGPLGFDQIVERSSYAASGTQTSGYLQSPHNWLLSLLLAGGIPFLLLIVAIGLNVIFVARRLGRYGDPTIRSALAAAAAILICASVDNALDVPPIVASMAMIGGLIYGKSIRSRRQ